ncbi:helix-turn-helix domain-containing protein [Streptomyces globisporus]|uniref:helix-turn-helix domain-containing protein n=1 Tax=Streptomyces globisporus TaxID=1908 RepID=UPI0004C96EE7|nr:helix-turn-helix domain-containing protein [Streptomyces globisporus]
MAIGAHGTGRTDGTGGTGRIGGAGAVGGAGATDEPGCSGCDTTTPWAELAAEMRRIKGLTELSYGKLAQRTHYSRSSWERFLNQKQLPTRVAVEEFAAAAGTDPGPLLLRLERSLAHETAARTAAAVHAGARGGEPALVPAIPAVRRETGLPGLGRPLGLLAAGALVGGGLVAVLNRAARGRRGL